jgi:hypothetical protein
MRQLKLLALHDAHTQLPSVRLSRDSRRVLAIACASIENSAAPGKFSAACGSSILSGSSDIRGIYITLFITWLRDAPVSSKSLETVLYARDFHTINESVDK